MCEKAMQNVFRANNKLFFIDGSISWPKEASQEVSLYEPYNSILISWIFNSIDKALQLSITYTETAKKIWDDLKEQFGVSYAPRIYQLKTKISSLK